MIDTISWITVYPEIVLLAMACIIALVDLGVKSPRRTGTYALTLLSLGVVAILQGLYASGNTTLYGFGNMVVSDPMGNWLKCFATIAVMVTLVYGRPYAGDRGMLHGGEMFTLSMFALLGMSVMISGNNFLVIYMGLELLTLSSYALVALRRDNATASDEVLCAGCLGFGLFAVRLVHAVWCHRHAGSRPGLQGHRLRPGQAPGAGVRLGVRGGRSGVQAGCGAIPHVDS